MRSGSGEKHGFVSEKKLIIDGRQLSYALPGQTAGRAPRSPCCSPSSPRGSSGRPKEIPEDPQSPISSPRCDLGKVNPYGVYDQNANTGWVSVGTDHDTAEFAVESIRRWWSKMRKLRYTDAIVLITADATGCVYGKSRLGGSVNESGLGLPARDQHVGTRSNIACSALSG